MSSGVKNRISEGQIKKKREKLLSEAGARTRLGRKYLMKKFKAKSNLGKLPCKR